MSRHVSFVKLDTEGHELACIRGMSLILERCFPSLCIEVSSDLDDPASNGSRLEGYTENARLRNVQVDWNVISTSAAWGAECKLLFFCAEEHLPDPEGDAKRLNKSAFCCFYEAYPPASGAASVSYNLAKCWRGDSLLLQLGSSDQRFVTDDGVQVATLAGASESRLKRLIRLSELISRIVAEIVKRGFIVL